jgi:hypothetical protein
MLMKPISALNDPKFDYTWFALSTGLLRQVLDNVGFRLVHVGQSRHYFLPHKVWVDRPTIVAERI